MNLFSLQKDRLSTWELINLLFVNDEDVVDSAYWGALCELHQRGTTEVLVAAQELCRSPCPLEQRTGCTILAQLGGSIRPFAAESFSIVLSVLQQASDTETLAAALCALGWLRDPRGVAYALAYLDHSLEDIRYWVTQTLTALHKDQRSIDGLIRLSTDICAKVRDWATFGLGSMTEQDTPAIRQALIARLDDPDIIVRGEALVGLAIRQDERVIAPLQEALEADIFNASGISDYAQEALDSIKDLSRYPQLHSWKTICRPRA